MLTLKHPKTTLIGILIVIASGLEAFGVANDPMSWNFEQLAAIAAEFLIGAGFIVTGDGNKSKTE